MMDIREAIAMSGTSAAERMDILPDGLVLLAYRGSIAHGMFVPQSDANSIDDKDVMGVFVNPLEHYLGFARRDSTERFLREWDTVCYELRKFVGLLLNCNPNVLSLLWLEQKHYIYRSKIAFELIANRELFVSKKAYHSFSGYAHSQFKRMTHFKFQGYMGEKRKALVEKFGYDTKNAAHLIRLLKMGIEFLMEGKLYVERTDAAELLSIKRGEWSLEKVKERAEQLFALAEESYVRSPLPSEPDRDKAEQLVVKLVADYHRDALARMVRS